MSIRLTAIGGLVTRLSGITPANGYTYNLAGMVDSGIQTRNMRLENQGNVHVQVGEGVEGHQILYATPASERSATLELIVDAMIQGPDNTTPWRTRLNNLLAEIHLRIDEDPSLGGVINRAWIARVDEPSYDPNGRFAFIQIRVAVDYEYTAGVTI